MPVGAAIAAAGAALVAVGAALPWVAVGRRNLSAFHLVTIARHFGAARSSGAAAVLDAWSFVPLLAGVAIAAALLGRRRTAVGIAVVVGLMGGAAAAFALHTARTGVLLGVWVTIAGSAFAVAGAVPGLVGGRSARPTRH
jgi:hypothetical protein